METGPYFLVFLIAAVGSLPSPQKQDATVIWKDMGRVSDSKGPYNGLEKNPEEAGYFEGDIVMSKKRAAMKSKSKQWPNGQLIYYIDPSFPANVQQIIRTAVHTIQTKTAVNGQSCITFKERTTELNFVHVRPLSGCFSAAGMMGGRQDLSIGRGCLAIGTIMHEFIHALGFFHEQSRPDRDAYVTIMEQNIEKGKISQFRKMTTYQVKSYTPYDYGSLMHYGSYAFMDPRKRQPTIVQKNTAGARIGQRTRLSDNDIMDLQLFYKCTTGGGVGPVVTQPPQPGPSKLSSFCNFNGKMSGCGWTNDKYDSMDWQRVFGQSPKGPSGDITGRGGYIYLSSSGNDGKYGNLVSPALLGNNYYCFSMYFHMNRNTHGRIQMLIGQNGQLSGAISGWTLSGDHGYQWRRFRATVPYNRGAFNIVVQGIAGNVDIAIDDVGVESGPC